MQTCPGRMMRYKRWATNGLNAVIAENLGRIVEPDRILVLRLLDHIETVDDIFRHHLEGRWHGHLTPRSIELPGFETLARQAAATADWYVAYAEGLPGDRREETVDFSFANGEAARMTREEILLHVALHGTWHRGNIGVILQKNCIEPWPDRFTDFLDETRRRAQRSEAAGRAARAQRTALG